MIRNFREFSLDNEVPETILNINGQGCRLISVKVYQREILFPSFPLP